MQLVSYPGNDEAVSVELHVSLFQGLPLMAYSSELMAT